MVKICPSFKKGYSTGFLPSHIKKILILKNIKFSLITLVKLDTLIKDKHKLNLSKINKAKANITTPPNLLGIDRKTA
jgi:hypothetical protein